MNTIEREKEMTASLYMMLLLIGVFFLGLMMLLAAWLIQWRYQAKLDYFAKVMKMLSEALNAIKNRGE